MSGVRRGVRRYVVLPTVISVLTLAGCTAQTTTNSDNSDPSEAETSVAETPVPEERSAAEATEQPDGESQFSNLPRLEGEAVVEMVVNGSPIVIKVDGTKAPVTAGNFVDLVQRGVYDNLVFHRVVTDPEPFVAQGGDPQSKDANFPVELLGTGGFEDPETGAPRDIPLEITPEGATEPVYSRALVSEAPALKHTRGAVAMARSQPPDSASSQFYFALADLEFLDGNYAVFGYVTEGMDVVDEIQQGDRIETATVTEGAENLKTGQ